MNAIIDLSSEAVSYINLLQDITNGRIATRIDLSIETRQSVNLTADECLPYLERITEMVWSSQPRKERKEISNESERQKQERIALANDLAPWLTMLADDLINWLAKNTKGVDFFAVPTVWREQIRQVLYAEINDEDTDPRWALAQSIRYLPLQVVQAVAVYNEQPASRWPLAKTIRYIKTRVRQAVEDYQKPIEGGAFIRFIAALAMNVRRQIAGTNSKPYRLRLYQVLVTHKEDGLFSAGDESVWEGFWKNRLAEAQTMLRDDTRLRSKLLEKGIALPFETIYSEELAEIARLRELRGQAAGTGNRDPYLHAQGMDLSGIALSGGGIRSATFNLGILQRLASLGLLRKFDYLSTVSGGGYVGSWLTNWIRQTGSIDKVSDRLCPVKSPSPHAEEVRPIRWLRMFSNYLAPNASIMSADAWTMGITWLRNTIINQIILLLLLMTGLSFVTLLFYTWEFLTDNCSMPSVWIFSPVIFAGTTVFAARGMRNYDRSNPPESRQNEAHSTTDAVWLVILSFLAACVLLTWCYCQDLRNVWDYADKLWPVGLFSLTSMCFISFLGRYRRCFPKDISKTYFVITTIFFSLIASAALVLMISACGSLVFSIKSTNDHGIYHFFGFFFQDKLIAIVGPPLFMEAGCIAVVVRMALFGRLFPDERREWWGRVGAIVHRHMAIWMLVTSSVLLIPDVFINIIPKYMPALFSGWGAIVGFGVKFAFGSGSGDENGTASKAKGLLIALAPFLFMLGFLLLGASAFRAILHVLVIKPYFIHHALLCYAEITVLFAALTYSLSRRVGVNEFSLHHFYRNRLVRAYLGAARRRTDRERSANSFTGFDKKDDYELAELAKPTNGYTGPYPLINTALNASTVTDLDRQDRKAESFLFSPLYSGFDFSPIRSAAYSRDHIFDYAYRQSGNFSRIGGPSQGTAMAISGAAVNPNQGFHSNSATAFLLTLFNVRLGWWIGNPRGKNWQRSDPRTGIGYLVKDMVGSSNISSNYVSLSDGGHFDNMGLYELVRRRCSYIVVCDAEEDHTALCSGLANAIRRCYIDFGADIKLDISPIMDKDTQTGYVKSHMAIGTITYAGLSGFTGTIVYIKASLTQQTEPDIREYAKINPAFPHQSTGDQFFDEAQFESYRKLGYNSVTSRNDLAWFDITMIGKTRKHAEDGLHLKIVSKAGDTVFDDTLKGTIDEMIKLRTGHYTFYLNGHISGNGSSFTISNGEKSLYNLPGEGSVETIFSLDIPPF